MEHMKNIKKLHTSMHKVNLELDEVMPIFLGKLEIVWHIMATDNAPDSEGISLKNPEDAKILYEELRREWELLEFVWPLIQNRNPEMYKTITDFFFKDKK